VAVFLHRNIGQMHIPKVIHFLVYLSAVFIKSESSSIKQDICQQRQKRRDGTGARQRRLEKTPQNILLHLQHVNRFIPWESDDSYQQVVKPITMMAGSSITSRLIEQNLQTSQDEVRLTFESGCNCGKMLPWLSTLEGRRFMHGARRLILILGTNDFHVVGVKGKIHRIKYTIESIRYSFPGVQIVWQLLQWRTKATRYISEGQNVLQGIVRCNVLLVQLARMLRFQTTDSELTRNHICCDNLHPIPNGSREIQRCIRTFLEQQ
jgi:hypothetical protein